MSRYILFCWLFFPLSMMAQLTPEQALKTLDEKYPQEKLHIFTDREEYAAGETVFFKAYLFAGYVKSLISSTVYIELYTDEVSMVKRVTVPMWDAVGSGTLELTESLPEGVYHLRAYTKWMLNFNPAFEFKSTILVYNTSSETRLAKRPVKWTAAAYPESGTLLVGEENKVSVRLTSLGSLPETWSGRLVNTARPNQTLLLFNSLTPDVAAFLFTPEADNAYEVHIKDGFENEAVVPLKPRSSGILLRAEQTGKEVYVDMFFKGIPDGGVNYKLVAQMQHQLVLSSVIRKKQDVVKTSIPVDRLMRGILHLTLFDPQGNPVTERLVFVEPGKNKEEPVYKINDDGTKIFLRTDSADYFNYAVSVTGLHVSAERTRNIFSDLWLGDLSHMPENSAKYFSGTDDDFLARDALMVTEKWARFQWEKILKNQFPVIKDSAEGYFSYKGTALRNNKAIGKEMLTLMFRFPDSSLQFLQVKTNDLGEFHLDNVVFYDSIKVYYQPAKGKQTSEVKIRFERKNGNYASLPPHLPATSYQLVDRLEGDSVKQLVTNAQQQLKAQKSEDAKYLQMDEVKVSAERRTKKELLNEELSSPLFQTQNQQVFDIINEESSIQSYANIFDWLDGRVSGLTFRIIGEGDPEYSLYNLELIGQRVPMMRDQSVSLFIDEMPADLAAVYSLPTSEIAMVKVIKGYFVGANSGGAGGGAIAIYTRKAGLQKNNRNSLPSGVIIGYSPLVNFGSNPLMEEGNLKFWSPLIIPLEGGQIMVDLSRKKTAEGYRITITGFTKDAQPVYFDSVRFDR